MEPTAADENEWPTHFASISPSITTDWRGGVIHVYYTVVVGAEQDGINKYSAFNAEMQIRFIIISGRQTGIKPMTLSC